MAKLLLLVTLVTMIIMVHGKFNFRKFITRRDPFPEPENPPPATSSVVEAWVTQRVDNYNPSNHETWQQRYLMNGEHFQPGGCIFLFLAGEWDVTPYRLEYSLMNELSQEFYCYMFYLEHRYYGESRPTEDVSDENLRFLTVQQALADTAHFITHIRSESVTPGAQDSPVIVIGGHYSGSLAAWFRTAYPHLTIGAWASSAPALAIFDHFQYKELAGAVYRHIGGNPCYDRLERGFAEMEAMTADGREDELVDMFNICRPFDSEQDRPMFHSTMSELFALLAQFENIVNVSGACNIMAADTASDAEAVSLVVHALTDDDACIDIDYEGIIAADRETSWDAPAVVAGFRQYTYHACTQLGWYHSSTSRFQPFGSGFPVDFILQACEDVFGEEFDPEETFDNIRRHNTLYGGTSPRGSNILYVHGQYDPWRTIGVQDDPHELANAIVIEGASQGQDLAPLREEDSDAVEAAKREIKETIGTWIREFHDIDIIPLDKQQ